MQSEVFRLVTGVPPVEDHCFSLVSKGASLDLEGASIEATKAWLKQLSAIINSSGKDIVLAADANQQQHVEHIPTPKNTEAAATVPPPAAEKVEKSAAGGETAW